MAKKALQGVRVVELAKLVAGPYCAKLLADLGAEVVKIEEPLIGDVARRRGPFLVDVPHPERSGLFLYLNTNKRSITLNIETETGRELFKQLVNWADILIESAPGDARAGAGLRKSEGRQSPVDNDLHHPLWSDGTLPGLQGLPSQ